MDGVDTRTIGSDQVTDTVRSRYRTHPTMPRECLEGTENQSGTAGTGLWLARPQDGLADRFWERAPYGLRPSRFYTDVTVDDR